MHRSRLLIVVAAMIALSGCHVRLRPEGRRRPGSGSTSVAGGDGPNFSTLTPYPAPTSNELPEAPDGFEPVFAQFVARHGARSLTDGELLDDTIALWEEGEGRRRADGRRARGSAPTPNGSAPP